MEILDGKTTSAQIREEIRQNVEELTSKGLKTPHLVAVLMGNDPASLTYVQNKIKACEKANLKSTFLHYNTDISETYLLDKIRELNEDTDVDGIIVQLPLPDHIDKFKVIGAVDPRKDVDGFHPNNMGRMMKNMPALLPATPNGIMTLFKRYKIETKGKHCVVIGRSEIVGSPISILMGRDHYPGNSTVTLTHYYTENLAYYTSQADILITAVGTPGLITRPMVKNEAVVVDVGITRVEDETKKKGYALKGDIDYNNVADKCSYITPVPGGVGPMTIAALLQNTLWAANKEIY